MKLSNSFVAVKKISSSIPRSNFPEETLNRTAELILEMEGVINPLILRQTSINSYEVVDGHLEYYAALRAKEINPQKGEYIGAFIIDPENEEAITEQVKLLRNQSNSITIPSVISSDYTDESRFNNIESRPTNLESRNETITNELQEELRREIKNINNRLKELENRLPKPVENSLEDKIEHLTSVVETLTMLVKQVIDPPKPQKLNLITATDEEITNYLTNENVNKKERKAALEAIRYWQKPNKTLTWANLKTSIKNGAEYSIKGFGLATYQKLKEIAEIRIQ